MELWPSFRKVRRIIFVFTSILSLLWVGMLSVYFSIESPLFVGRQRQIIIGSLVLSGVTSLLLYLMVIAKFYFNWEAFRIGLLLLLHVGSAVSFTLNGPLFPCSASPDNCRMLRIFSLVGSWLLAGILFLYATFLPVIPCIRPSEQKEKECAAIPEPIGAENGLWAGHRYGHSSVNSQTSLLGHSYDAMARDYNEGRGMYPAAGPGPVMVDRARTPVPTIDQQRQQAPPNYYGPTGGPRQVPNDSKSAYPMSTGRPVNSMVSSMAASLPNPYYARSIPGSPLASRPPIPESSTPSRRDFAMPARPAPAPTPSMRSQTPIPQRSATTPLPPMSSATGSGAADENGYPAPNLEQMVARGRPLSNGTYPSIRWSASTYNSVSTFPPPVPNMGYPATRPSNATRGLPSRHPSPRAPSVRSMAASVHSSRERNGAPSLPTDGMPLRPQTARLPPEGSQGPMQPMRDGSNQRAARYHAGTPVGQVYAPPPMPQRSDTPSRNVGAVSHTMWRQLVEDAASGIK